jgi:hypothetical protein
VGGTFCDLTKSLDCVNHDTLLSKLNLYGITGKANKWINSYLKNRYQREKIKNKNCRHKVFSNWGIRKHGVRQGSILRPFLFLPYIKDLSQTINKKNLNPFYLQMTLHSLIFENSKSEDYD